MGVFLMLINLNLDFHLQTQVLHNGQILIVAIDTYNREVFCLGMKRAPKRKPKVKEPGAEEDEDD